MDLLSITIKTISPMFASNDGKNFGLTSQSVRGVMRFWYRAVLPRVINIHQGGRFKALKKAEELLFGSTEKKSSFDLIVSYKVNYGKRISYDSGEKLPAFTSSKYDIYSIYGISNRESYLDIDSDIVLDFVIKDKKNEKEIKQLIQDLFVFISFVGGFGAKSRKGFGSFEIINVTYSLKLSESLNVLSESIKKFLEKFDKFDFTSTIIPNNTVPDYPMLAKGYSYLVESPKTFSRFKEIYSYLYKMDRNKDRSGLYIKLKHALRTNNGIDSFRTVQKNTVFYQSMMGLPILYNRGRTQLESPKNPRKASPVFISVHKDKNKKYFLRFVILYSKLYNHDDGILNPILMFDDLEVRGSEEFDVVKNKIKNLLKTKGVK